MNGSGRKDIKSLPPVTPAIGKLWIFVEENPDTETKKSDFYFTTCKRKLSDFDEWRVP